MNAIYFLALATIVLATLNVKTKENLRALFLAKNQFWTEHHKDSYLEYTESFVIKGAANEHYFHVQKASKSTFALVTPENGDSKGLAQAAISGARTIYQTFGFQPAARLLKDSVSPLFREDQYWEAKAAALFATQNEASFEVITTGELWAGLYRSGVLVNFTKPFKPELPIQVAPEEFLTRLSQVYGLRQMGSKSEWLVEADDVVLITRASVQNNFKDIIDIAVEAANESSVPLSQLVANLRPYLEVYHSRENVIAALKLV